MLTDTAPSMAIQTLQILRNFYFVSSRLGANAFSQYSFIYLTAIDIVSEYPVQVEAFLREIGPSEIGHIPHHPLDRCHDLYFLNTAEHFALVLSPQTTDNLLIRAAKPYLGLGGDERLLEIFEAAHSVMLAVFAAPQNTELVTRYINGYLDALFKVSPSATICEGTTVLINLPTGLPTASFSTTVPHGCQKSDTNRYITLSHRGGSASIAFSYSRDGSLPHSTCLY